MSDGRYILKVLKESGTSRFIKELTPDGLVPNIRKAIQISLDEEEGTNREKQGSEKQDSERSLRDRAFHTPRTVSYGCHFAYTVPEKRPHYKPLIKSSFAHADLDLKLDNELEKLLSGEKFHYDATRGIFPYSMAYAGFQFGQFAGQLGDGRVVNLFDVKDKQGNWQTLQLKGSGMTPFSRFADGKAVLRSSIREFIISEALYNIGIPATRALQLTSLPKTRAQRGMIYEPTAVICRAAPCWIRLGNFDLFRWKPDLEGLIKLSDYAINEIFNHGKDFRKNLDLNIFRKDFFPDEEDEAWEIDKIDGITQYDLFFRHVATKNAECLAYWQTYGFLNGVLNTDNVSIMGISMDFGPFSFLDKYQPNFTPNHDDIQERYSFENQPGVLWWNIVQFAQSISILLGAGKKHIRLVKALQETMGQMPKEVEDDLVSRANNLIKAVRNEYNFTYITKYMDLMSKRLGIDLKIPKEMSNEEDIDSTAKIVEEFREVIVQPLLNILEYTQIDYNNFFVKLQNFQGQIFNSGDDINGVNKTFASIFFTDNQLGKLNEFFAGNKALARSDSGETLLLTENFAKIIEWASNYSRYSGDDKIRGSIAKKFNPLFIPRSWIFQEVIDDLMDNQKSQLNNPTEQVDTTLLKKLYLMSSNPYDPTEWDSSLRPDLEKKWSSINHSLDETKYMQKASCSS